MPPLNKCHIQTSSKFNLNKLYWQWQQISGISYQLNFKILTLVYLMKGSNSILYLRRKVLSKFNQLH